MTDMKKIIEKVLSIDPRASGLSGQTKLTLPEPRADYQRLNDCLEASSYPLYQLDTQIRAALAAAGLIIPSETLIEQPKVAGSDFVLATKALFDANKERFATIIECANGCANTLQSAWISRIIECKAQGPFVNMHCSDKFFAEILAQITSSWEHFGTTDRRKETKAIIDYSSPNMGKQMTVGHLRSTIIGQTLQMLAKFQGAEMIKRNYLWDRWTPFGKLIYSFLHHRKTQGDELLKSIETDPTDTMGTLYASFKDINDDQKDERAKGYFRLLEEGNVDLLELRNTLRSLTLVDFQQVYKRMDIEFDVMHGESFSQQLEQGAFEDLEKSGYLHFNDWAYLVKFVRTGNDEQLPFTPVKEADYAAHDPEKLVPFLIKKSDGATLYSLRDLGLVKYKTQKMHANLLYYVVGSEQKDHFAMVNALSTTLWYIQPDSMFYAGFGLILLDGKKMSSRQGTVYRLAQLLDLVKEKVLEETQNRVDETTADKLAISAVIFNDLKNDRQKDINFDLDQMTKTHGDTGVYLQYSRVRILSLLKKISDWSSLWSTYLSASDFLTKNANTLSPVEKSILKKCGLLPEVIATAAQFLKPHIIAQHTLDLCREINNRYALSEKILDLDSDQQIAKTHFLLACKITLDKLFELLHLPNVEQM